MNKLMTVMMAASVAAACANSPTGPSFGSDPDSPGEQPAPTPSNVPDLSGRWEGEIPRLDVALGLDIFPSTTDQLNGLGELSIPGGDAALMASGKVVVRPQDPPAVLLELQITGGGQIDFEGALMDGSIFAELRGGGFKGELIELERVASAP